MAPCGFATGTTGAPPQAGSGAAPCSRRHANAAAPISATIRAMIPDQFMQFSRWLMAYAAEAQACRRHQPSAGLDHLVRYVLGDRITRLALCPAFVSLSLRSDGSDRNGFPRGLFAVFTGFGRNRFA
jgi:hypothetical protein